MTATPRAAKPEPLVPDFTPARPNLLALGILSLFVVILSLPMLSGHWLAAPGGDQYSSAYAFYSWEAQEWHAAGTLPLWNPMIMGGLPFLAVVTHGDILYPTALLRAFLPIHVVMNLAFFLHYILAGFFTYLFLRRFAVSWTAAVTGGVAYQLTGILISLVQPGHDGKLFVSTMLPLAFLALVTALRDRRWWGYPLLAVAVALCLLSPHVQATYYLLIATALFALYLTFGEPAAEPLRPRITRLALTLGAVVVGFGVAAPQLLPFLEYIPYSPRAGGYTAGSGAASFGIPWDHIPEFFIGGFTGAPEAYWGSNPLKLHSEYLGLPVIALAILGVGDRRRRLVWWLGGIGLLFLLIAMGNATPFYQLWWSVMPMVKKTRAPGMVFFIVSFVVATFAAFGITRLEREGQARTRTALNWMISAGVIALLGAIGVFGKMAVGLAQRERVAEAIAHGDAIRISAIIGAMLFAAMALLVWGKLQGRVPALAFALGLPILVGADLWRDGKHFWTYSPAPQQGLYRTDDAIARLQAAPKPLRVLNLNVYPQNVLMAHGIPQVLGYQGNELRSFDELIGGRPSAAQPQFLFASTRLWDLLAVRYVLIGDTASIPGYHLAFGPVMTAAGTRAYGYEADTIPPYARVVPAAVKVDASAIPITLADPRLPGYDHVVLFSPDAPVNPPQLQKLPEPIASKARVTAWGAGRMTIALDPAPTDSAYVLVSENWYVDWRASVDGGPARVLRGDHSLITVPVGPGAKTVELSYYSRTFARGKAVALFSILVVLAGFIAPPVIARRRRG